MCYYIVCIPSWLVQPAEVLFRNAEVPQTEYPGILPLALKFLWKLSIEQN